MGSDPLNRLELAARASFVASPPVQGTFFPNYHFPAVRK